MQKIDKKYTDYADKVIKGEIVACEYIKLACQRYLDLFKREDLYFDTAACDKVVRFISKLKHFRGKHAGKPFILSDWQEWCVYAIYGFKHKEDGNRLIRKVYLEVPRKNGKTALVAALCCYHLVADGEQGGEVVLAATSAQQAHICFDMAQKFLLPFNAGGKLFKTYRDSIKFDATNSILRVVSNNASSIEGANCSMFVVDEIEMAQNGDIYESLDTSTVAREQPLSVCIGTAGFNRSSFAYQMRETFIQILNGTIMEDASFCAFYTIDSGDDPFIDDMEERRKIVQKCNPNLDITTKFDSINQELQRSQNNPILQTSVLTRFFDMWLSSQEEWISQDYILKSQQKWEYSDFPTGTWAYGGIDLAAVSDLTCVSVMIPDNGEFYFRNYYFVPQEQLDVSRNRDLYRKWARQGFLNVTPGNVTDYDIILKHIYDINKTVMFSTIGYDPWNSTQFVTDCVQAGLIMDAFQQAIANYNKPTKEFARNMLGGKVKMYPNPIDNWCFSNVAIKRDYNENERPVKGGGEDGKIDGVVAMLTCFGNYLVKTNPWEYSVVTVNGQ